MDNKKLLEQSASNLIETLFDLTETAKDSKTIEEYTEPLDVIDKTLACLKKLAEIGIILFESEVIDSERNSNND